MRTKKKKPIIRFLSVWGFVLVALYSVFMLVFINYLADKGIQTVVHNELSRQVRKASEYVKEVDGKITLPKKMKRLDEDFYFVILDKEGRAVAGKYPEGYIEEKNEKDNFDDEEFKKKSFREVKFKGETWYVLDRFTLIERWAGIDGDYVIRGMKNKRDIDTFYRNIKKYSYIGIVIEFFGLMIIGFVLQRHLSRPMKNMCVKVEKISDNLDLSERMEYDGMFKEMDVLINAHNELLTRMDKIVSSQEQFNSDVSHELRTPIAIIRAQCQLIQEQMDEETRQKMGESLSVIERQSEKMNKIVEQLLSLSRIDQEKQRFEREEIDLVDIVEAVCEDEEGMADKPITFSYDLNTAIVTADISLLTMAVRNLISNAIKYSPQGGKIEVCCGETEKEGYVSVRDHGCGIPKEKQQQIFEYYYRVEESRNSEGFGLGLTIAGKIAQKHGGKITVESEEGKGSKFVLTLKKNFLKE